MILLPLLRQKKRRGMHLTFLYMKKLLFLSLLISLSPIVSWAQPRQGAVKPTAKATPSSAAPATGAINSDTPLKSVFFPATGLADGDGWTTYHSPADAFQAAFPKEPVAMEASDGSSKKNGSRYYLPEQVSDGKLNLTVSVWRLGALVTDEDVLRDLYTKWVEGLMDNGQNRVVGKKVLDREFVERGRLGIEVIVDREKFRFHGKAFYRDGKLYEVGVGSPIPTEISAEAKAEGDKLTKKFLDSFQLL
jgi:hypothetical protein